MGRTKKDQASGAEETAPGLPAEDAPGGAPLDVAHPDVLDELTAEAEAKESAPVAHPELDAAVKAAGAALEVTLDPAQLEALTAPMREAIATLTVELRAALDRIRVLEADLGKASLSTLEGLTEDEADAVRRLVQRLRGEPGTVRCRVHAGTYRSDRDYGVGDLVDVPAEEVEKLRHCLEPLE